LSSNVKQSIKFFVADAKAVLSVHVELPDGTAFSSAMPMAATFKDLETAIQEQFGVDMTTMELTVGPECPDAGDLLMDFTYTVKVAPRSFISFVVNTLTGKKTSMRASKFATVAHVKELIREVEGFPLDQQRLIFGGEQLEDDRSLASYNVTSDSTLHLVLRLRGGMYHSTSGRRDLTNLDLPDEELWEFVLPDGTAMFLRSNDQERARDTAARVEACLQLKAWADALPAEDGQGQRARITAEMERLGMVAV
jgi:Ubiquitin family